MQTMTNRLSSPAPRYNILILTYNRLDALRMCIASLSPTLSRANVELVILDNGSEPPTRDYVTGLPGQFPPGKVRIVLLPENLGVAGGRDRLLDEGRSPILIFLDSDITISDPAWIDRLGSALAPAHVGLSGVGGGYVLPDWSGFVLGPVGECDIVSGYCQAFKREVVAAGARLDLRYGKFWTEDSAFCLSIRALGWKIWNCGLNIGLEHHPGRSGDEPGLLEHNMALFRSQFKGKGLIKSEGAY